MHFSEEFLLIRFPFIVSLLRHEALCVPGVLEVVIKYVLYVKTSFCLRCW